jgi:hypothetical protein
METSDCKTKHDKDITAANIISYLISYFNCISPKNVKWQNELYAFVFGFLVFSFSVIKHFTN